MKPKESFDILRLSASITFFAAFWTLAVVMWQTTGGWFYLVNFGYIGTSVAVGMALYTILPPKKKERGRKLAQLLVGIYMLGLLGFLARENMQIEGFFFYLLTGFYAGAVIHYLVAKIIGPLLFHRGWCSWACWTAMALDFLPYTRNKEGRLPEKWGYLRYAHLVLSLGIVVALWYGFHYRVDPMSMTELYWLVIGNAIYFGVGIAMAFLLKDNRAFCKYACPIPVFQKLTSRFAVMKIAGDYELCNDCDACVKMCPMDIRIPEYLKQGKRILSTECTFCLVCVNVCAKKALKTSYGFDIGGLEILNQRVSITQ
jgi:Pyruvate/2-oxoacid:ferredoxin oxidoreductase delta subunit